MRLILKTKQMVQQLRTHLYRNALYLIINSIVTGIVGLVFWILAARFYSAKDMGFDSAIISATMLLALLSA